MLFVQLDVNWVDNPKLIRAGLDGAGLHAITMCLAKRLNTDGWVDELLLRRYGGTTKLIARLVELGLLEQHGTEVRPNDWLDRNPSQAAIDAVRASKAEAAKEGNHKRWRHSGPVTDCAKCNPEPQVVAGCDRTGVAPESASDPKRSPYTESETDPETELTPSDATVQRSRAVAVKDTPAFDEFWDRYPKKIAKGAARRAWDKAVAAAGGTQAVIDGAARYAIEARRLEPRFVKHPATWLNGECWTDQPMPNGHLSRSTVSLAEWAAAAEGGR